MKMHWKVAVSNWDCPYKVEPDCRYSDDEIIYCDNAENKTAETLYGVVTRLGVCNKENCPLRLKAAVWIKGDD
ncbi:MAG: hypothetical protein PWR10_1807 [Halanaerobiales bacterium]|nr:hypothetical protein [Halanaerobiales bacterium]